MASICANAAGSKGVATAIRAARFGAIWGLAAALGLYSLSAMTSAAGLRLMPDTLLRPLLGLLGAVRPEVQAYAASACRQVPKRDLLVIWDGILQHFHFEPGYRIEHPLLLAHGIWDYGIGFGAIPLLAPRWAAREPRCRYEVIPAAGHLATQDNPEVFNRLLLEFLAENVPPSGP